jgi:hypothetical protein
MTGPQELREAFIKGAKNGQYAQAMGERPEWSAEALRRYPDPPQGSESSTPVMSNATMYAAGQASEGKWKCTKCGVVVSDPWDGGHLVEMCHPTWCGPVEPVKEDV